MNYDECLKYTINDSVKDVLKRLPELAPEDRFHILMEWFEVVACPIDVEEVLIVPNFQKEVQE
mgnify:CR=1 FL=1